MIIGIFFLLNIVLAIHPKFNRQRKFDIDHSIIEYLNEYGPVVEGINYSVNSSSKDVTLKVWIQFNVSKKDPKKSLLTIVRLDNLTEHPNENIDYCHDNDVIDLLWRRERGWPDSLLLKFNDEMSSNMITIPSNKYLDSMQIEINNLIFPARREKIAQEIPRIIHQVGGDHKNCPLKVVEKAMILVRLKNPNYQHEITSIEEMEKYILDNEGPQAAMAFKSLKPIAFKTDLFRVVALHRKGGVYLDSKLVPLRGMDEILPEKGSFLVKERLSIPGFQSAFMAMVPGDPLMRKAIDSIIENCENHFYGNDALEPTGPRLIGHCFLSEKIIRNHYTRSCKFTSDAKSIIDSNGNAIIIYHNGEYRRINNLMQGSSHYNELWNRKDIYVIGRK